VLAAGRFGVSEQEVLVDTGVTSAALRDARSSIPVPAWARVWERAVELTREPALGVLAAEELEPGYFGVVEYSARACATLGEALPMVRRYYRLANGWARLELTRRPASLELSRSVLGDELGALPPQTAEFAIAAFVRALRRAVAEPVQIVRVRFRHRAPPSTRQHERFFDCPIEFRADRDAFELPASALAARMSAADPTLRALVERHAEALLTELEPPEVPLSAKVRREVLTRLRDGVSIEAVARALGSSVRTLQRRLGEEGVAFRTLVEEVRVELGRRYLASGIPVGEVAFLLGYSETSAFHRAFRAASGATPAAYFAAEVPGAGARERRLAAPPD
ncbi:MAG: AraC family transcriptional regulator, partial [Sorangiineae bacterium]|nr:AraC family transcriptional regulator [Sorangiineae bacterium]